jgi:DNA-binding response OmpR family regulator
MSVGSGVCMSRARILIVDDVRDNSELLQIMLNWEGFVTQIAGSGEEALASVAAEPPDLMLLDLGLPGLSGYEVTSQMKGNVATKDIPVVIISGRGDDATRMRVLSAGAVDFIVKPIDRADLCQRVRNALRLKTAGLSATGTFGRC